MTKTTQDTHRIHNLETAMEKLAQSRDELRLELHLAKADARDEWTKVEKRWQKLRGRFKDIQHSAAEAGEEVWQDIELLADDVKGGYKKVRDAL